jgi:hypothetical protein
MKARDRPDAHPCLQRDCLTVLLGRQGGMRMPLRVENGRGLGPSCLWEPYPVTSEKVLCKVCLPRAIGVGFPRAWLLEIGVSYDSSYA